MSQLAQWLHGLEVLIGSAPRWWIAAAGALWLVSVIFLAYSYRRQRALRVQLMSLRDARDSREPYVAHAAEDAETPTPSAPIDALLGRGEEPSPAAGVETWRGDAAAGVPAGAAIPDPAPALTQAKPLRPMEVGDAAVSFGGASASKPPVAVNSHGASPWIAARPSVPTTHAKEAIAASKERGNLAAASIRRGVLRSKPRSNGQAIDPPAQSSTVEDSVDGVTAALSPASPLALSPSLPDADAPGHAPAPTAPVTDPAPAPETEILAATSVDPADAPEHSASMPVAAKPPADGSPQSTPTPPAETPPVDAAPQSAPAPSVETPPADAPPQSAPAPSVETPPADAPPWASTPFVATLRAETPRQSAPVPDAATPPAGAASPLRGTTPSRPTLRGAGPTRGDRASKAPTSAPSATAAATGKASPMDMDEATLPLPGRGRISSLPPAGADASDVGARAEVAQSLPFATPPFAATASRPGAEPGDAEAGVEVADDPIAAVESRVADDPVAAAGLKDLLRALYLDESMFRFSALALIEGRDRALASALVSAWLVRAYPLERWEAAFQATQGSALAGVEPVGVVGAPAADPGPSS